MNRPLLPRLLLIPFCLLSCTLGACSQESAAPKAEDIRPTSLFDQWSEVHLENPTPPPEYPPLGEFRFDDLAGIEFKWTASQGVADLQVEDGRLIGRTTSDNPILLLETTAPLGAEDELWAAKITLQASAGTRVGIHPVKTAGPPISQIIARAGEWPLSSPLVPGADSKTYTVELDHVFTLELPLAQSSISQVLVRPSNVAGTEFAIESVRCVFRKEHLASIPSGPGWHGLGEVFRESLVSRSPESLRFEVTLPEKPWLDLNIGTVEEIPPRFSVSVAPSNGEPSIVEHYQVEGPESWTPIRLDLTKLAGETVEVTLSSTADAPGTLAFWGSPVIRNSTDIATRPQAVVVFLADTLRSDHLEAWGHDRPTAPTLTGLATQGVRFSDVIAQATWTKVSVSSILTSLYPSTTGIIDLNDRLAAAETTLAEAFRQAGYATFATSSVPFSGQLTNLHQGVEVLYEFGANAELKGDYQSKTAKVWVDQYLKWLELHRDVPTFALIHAMDPHSPFKPATPYDTLWTNDADAEQFEKQSAQLKPHIESPLLRRFMAPTSEEIAAAGVDEASFLRHEKNWYDGSIRGLDAQLERLINRLDELGLGQRTLLAFIADHGEAFLEHGEHWHGNNVYGEVANVPWVLWGQGVPSGQVVEETVQNLDIMPTLLALSGIPIPERAQGRSLVPLLSGTASRALPAFTEHRVGPEEADAFSSFAMVRDGKKLIWNIDPPKGRSVHELYDHKADPLDLKNIAGEHPDLVRKMATELESWQTWAEGQKLDQDAVASDLSAEELERLRSLGYVE